MLSNSKYVNAFKKCPKILKIDNACFDSFFFYLNFSVPFLFTSNLNNLELQKHLHIKNRNFELKC